MVEFIFLVSCYAIEAVSRIILFIVMDPLSIFKPSSLKVMLGWILLAKFSGGKSKINCLSPTTGIDSLALWSFESAIVSKDTPVTGASSLVQSMQAAPSSSCLSSC